MFTKDKINVPVSGAAPSRDQMQDQSYTPATGCSNDSSAQHAKENAASKLRHISQEEAQQLPAPHDPDDPVSS